MNTIEHNSRLKKCQERLVLDVGSQKAFADREARLIERVSWPLTHWYTDEDFCRAYNTAVQLQAEIERLRVYPAAVDEVRSRYPTDVFPDSAGTGAKFVRSLCDRIHELAAEAAKGGN